MQFEVKPEAVFRRGLAHGLEDAHDRLGRGEMRRRFLIPQPVAARLRSRFRQADAAAHALDRAEHLAGLSPRAIEHEDVRALRLGGLGRRGRQRFAIGMEDPQLAVMSECLRREARGGKEAALALVDVAAGTGDRPREQLAGARRLVMLVTVDQHMDVETGVDRRYRVADTPPRR